MSRKIVLTGGGTAGHVTPNLSLYELLKANGWEVEYVGSENGIEKEMMFDAQIPYHAVKSGKLRRYFSWENFKDPFKILFGLIQAFFILRRVKPQVVFSKGGFVAFPVVVGAWLNRIPVVVHESDMTPGLANRLSFPFADKICLTFSAAKKHLKCKEKAVVTGTPIRNKLFQGDKAKARELCHFATDKPAIMIIGGSQGAQSINTCVRKALPQLLQYYQVIHICGRGKIDAELAHLKGYCQFEYVKDELAHLFALSDVVLSRSGANSLYEILALSKPHVLVPLPRRASRGDQIQNARYFEKQGISMVIPDEQLTPERLVTAIDTTYQDRNNVIAKIKNLNISSASDAILKILESEIETSGLTSES